MNYPPELRADGRIVVTPVCVPPGTDPLPLRRKQCRDIIDAFKAQGMRSNHTTRGGTLWVVLYYCQWAELPYTLTYWPNMGYTVQVLGPATEKDHHGAPD